MSHEIVEGFLKYILREERRLIDEAPEGFARDVQGALHAKVVQTSTHFPQIFFSQ